MRDELLKAMRKQKHRILSSITGSSHSNTNSNNSPGGTGAGSSSFIFKGGKNISNTNNLNRGPSNQSSSSYRLDTKQLLLGNYKPNNKSNNNSELLDSSSSTSQPRRRPLFCLEYIFDLVFCFCMRSSSTQSASGQSLSTNLDSNPQNFMNNAGKLNGSFKNKQSNPTHYSSDSTSKATSKHSAIISIDENDEEEENNNVANHLNEQHESLAHLLHNSNLPDAAGLYQNHQQLNLQTLSYLQQQHINNHLNSYLTAQKSIYYNNASLNSKPTGNESLMGANFSIIPLLNSTLVKNAGVKSGMHVLTTGGVGPIHHLQSIRRNSNSSQNMANNNEFPNRFNLNNHSFNSHTHYNPLHNANMIVLPPNTVPPSNPNPFSTFKAASFSNKSNMTNSNKSKQRMGNYDENQYLTPECNYHDYSTVDASGKSEENDNESCNNYVEVIDEFIDDCPPLRSHEVNYLNSSGHNKTKLNTNNKLKAYRNSSSNERIVQSSTTSSDVTTTGGEADSNTTSPCQSSISSSTGMDLNRIEVNSNGEKNNNGDSKASNISNNLLLIPGTNENSKAKQVLRRL